MALSHFVSLVKNLDTLNFLNIISFDFERLRRVVQTTCVLRTMRITYTRIAGFSRNVLSHASRLAISATTREANIGDIN